MIVVDASALVAIVLHEEDRDDLLDRLMHATRTVMSPVNLWEVLRTVQARVGDDGPKEAIALIELIGVEITPATLRDALEAFEAVNRYGRAPAKLNLGDTFAYALAKRLDAPLLFKGEDFTHTDLKRA